MTSQVRQPVITPKVDTDRFTPDTELARILHPTLVPFDKLDQRPGMLTGAQGMIDAIPSSVGLAVSVRPPPVPSYCRSAEYPSPAHF